MILTITDANIFIDLGELELFDLFFQLDITIHTTAEVLLECDPEHRKVLRQYVKKKLLTVHVLTEEQITKLNQLEFNKGLSVQDKSILYLAYEVKAMVLTGDKLIRKWCVRYEMEVHGILWVLDELTKKELLTFKEAIQKLEDLLLINQWLPAKASKKMIDKWKKS